jgi:hypothetical protein
VLVPDPGGRVVGMRDLHETRRSVAEGDHPPRRGGLLARAYRLEPAARWVASES